MAKKKIFVEEDTETPENIKVEVEEKEIVLEEEEEESPPPPPKKVKKKRVLSEERKAQLREQLAKGRAKSAENRRKNKMVKEIAKKKKVEERDRIILEDIEQKKK